MVTWYSPDGNRIALAHFCSMGIHPRIETPALTMAANEFDFSLIGAGNLSSPADPQRHHMVLRIGDNDHFIETWTAMNNGRQETDTFHFARK
jgi:hypothetical protein